MNTEGPEIETRSGSSPPRVHTPTVNTIESASSSSTQRSPQNKWKKILRQLPLSSLVAVIGIILCLTTSLVALRQADNNAITRKPWDRISPSVILSLSAVLTNMLLRYVVFEGSVVTWWRSAFQGTTLSDLHWEWEFRTIVGVVAGIIKRKFSWLALATLTVTAAAAHGALFQSSVKVDPLGTKTLPLDKTEIRIRIAEQLPPGWTGILDGHNSSKVSFMTDAFSFVVFDSSMMRPIELKADNDAGVAECSDGSSCLMIVRGVGLNWTAATTTFDYDNPNITLDFGRSPTPDARGPVSFYVGFTPEPKDSDYLMTLDILWKDKQGCDTKGKHRRFKFRPATTSYLIQVNNKLPTGASGTHSFLKSESLTATVVGKHNTNPYPYIDAGIYPPSYLKNLTEFKELQFLQKNGQKWQLPNMITDFNKDITTYGGIALGLNTYLASFARYLNSTNGEELPDTFGMFNQLLFNGTLDPGQITKTRCEATWKDPTEYILTYLDDMMFRSAINASYSDSKGTTYNEVSVVAVKVKVVASFKIRWRRAIAAASLPIIGILFLLPTFWGYWELDRKFTGSPVEVANAFDGTAVLFQSHHGYEVDELLKEIGDRKVKYDEDTSRMVPGENGTVGDSNSQNQRCAA